MRRGGLEEHPGVGAPMRELDADGLSLEPQIAEHADAMFVVLSDPAIYEYENEPPRSLEALRERFAALESRCSRDGTEQWLNWVIRLPSSELIGYVQATVHSDGRADVAYVLHSDHWGRGLARRAVAAMIRELVLHHGVRSLSAVLKRENVRSMHLLHRLGFESATTAQCAESGIEEDEYLMLRRVDRG